MRRRDMMAGLALLAYGAQAQAQAQDDALFDTAGYRRARYRAVVDRTPDPATRIGLADALALDVVHGALFIDVLPAEGALRDPASGRWTLAEPHDTIPGALWFPECGRAAPDALLWAALRDRVLRTRAAHPGWPIVVFCRADCWMSWNAARRLAREDGVPGVRWFAEGIDGWHDAHRALRAAQPVPVAA